MGELGDEVHLHNTLIGFLVGAHEGAICADELAAFYGTHTMTQWGRASACGLRSGERVLSEYALSSEIPVGKEALVECVPGEVFNGISIFLLGEVVETWEWVEVKATMGDGIFF